MTRQMTVAIRASHAEFISTVVYFETSRIFCNVNIVFSVSSGSVSFSSHSAR